MTRQEGRPHISFSQIKTYMDCGVLYENVYLKGKRRPPGVAMLKGGSVHRVRDKSLRRKLEGMPLPSVMEVRDIAADDAELAFKGEVEIEAGRNFADVRDETKDAIVRLSVLDRETHQVKIDPVAIEDPIEIEIPGITKSVKMILDVVDKNRVIRDLKTSSKTPPETIVKRNDQLNLYTIGHQVKYDIPASGTALDYVIDKKEPAAVSFEHNPSEQEVQVTLNRLGRVLQNIEKGVFTPAPADSWKCTAKFCGFFEGCPFGQGGRER